MCAVLRNMEIRPFNASEIALNRADLSLYEMAILEINEVFTDEVLIYTRKI